MQSMAELRARIQGLHSPLHRESFSFSLMPEGIPRGALVELSGRGKCECVAAFLAENPQYTIWIEEKRLIFPTALIQRKVNLKHIHFVEGGKEAPWALAAALRSKAFPILIYDGILGDEKDHRRWQLLAEKSNATVLLLREKHREFWPIFLSLKVNGRKIEVLRKK